MGKGLPELKPRPPPSLPVSGYNGGAGAAKVTAQTAAPPPPEADRVAVRPGLWRAICPGSPRGAGAALTRGRRGAASGAEAKSRSSSGS